MEQIAKQIFGNLNLQTDRAQIVFHKVHLTPVNGLTKMRCNISFWNSHNFQFCIMSKLDLSSQTSAQKSLFDYLIDDRTSLGINSLHQINSTYVPSTDSHDKILKSHSDFVKSVGLKFLEEDQDLPYLYWTSCTRLRLTTVLLLAEANAQQ